MPFEEGILVFMVNRRRKAVEDIIKVLMSRDGMSYDDAKEQVLDFKKQIDSGEISYDDLEEEFMSEFGLEPDYLLALLGF